MNKATVKIAFPDVDDAEAHEQAQNLLSELKQDSDLRPQLDLTQTKIIRTDQEALDFGTTLIAVLGTPAIIILARAIRSWMERTGTDMDINGVRIRNVRSQDAAAIIEAALKTNPPEAVPER
jgi:hypothetical protein